MSKTLKSPFNNPEFSVRKSLESKKPKHHVSPRRRKGRFMSTLRAKNNKNPTLESIISSYIQTSLRNKVKQDIFIETEL